MDILIKYGKQLLGFEEPYKLYEIHVYVDNQHYKLFIDTRDKDVDDEYVDDIIRSLEDCITGFEDVKEDEYGVNPRWTIVEYTGALLSPEFHKVLEKYFQRVMVE